MSIKAGISALAKVKIGLNDIVKIMAGTQKIWPFSVLDSCLIFSSTGNFTVSHILHASKTWDGILEVSVDGGLNWTEFQNGSSISGTANSPVLMRGIGNTKITSQDAFFELTGSNISCIGNIENLLDYQQVERGQHPVPANYAFRSLFDGCTALVRGPDISTVTLSTGCFAELYYRCQNLEYISCMNQTVYPSLCCYAMYSGCSKIKMSKLKTLEYSNEFRMPNNGIAELSGSLQFNGMLSNTGGSFTGNPTINTTYYTSNTVDYQPETQYIVTSVFVNISSILSYSVNFTQSEANGVYVDWGDGTCETSGDLDASITHVYESAGSYKITFQCLSGVTYDVGSNDGWFGFVSAEGYIGSPDITKVVLDEHIRKIKGLAFYGNSNMTEIRFSAGITEIGTNAFESCGSLNKVNIDDIGSWCGVTVQYSSNSPFYRGAGNLYSNDVLITNLQIPQGTETVNPNVFAYCKSISSVLIPGSVSQMSRASFDSCTNLTSIYVDENNSYYDSYDGILLNRVIKSVVFAPYGISGSVVIPNGIEVIESNAFDGTTLLTSVVFPQSLREIKSYAFRNSGISGNITLMAETLGRSIFSGCSSLTGAWIRDSVINIAQDSTISSFLRGIFVNVSPSFSVYCEPDARPNTWFEKFNAKSSSEFWPTTWGQKVSPF